MLFLRSQEKVPQEPAYDAVLLYNDISIPITIADTDASRQKGLSDTASLSDDTGKLFMFDVPGNYGFWMKDMYYPIDIVWIGADWTVVDITANISPSTYPAVFYPKTDAQFVLEVNDGFTYTHGIVPGEKFILKR